MYLNLLMKIVTLALILFLVDVGYSQDLEPRYLSSSPTELNVAIISYGYSTGDILLNNNLPIDDLNAGLNSISLVYLRSFKLFNRLAKIDAVIPYAFGNYTGVVNNITESLYTKGFGDPMVRLSMIFIGVKPLTPKEYANRDDKKFKLGALTRIVIPIGQYNSRQFINLGTNRWALKFGVAGSYKLSKRFILETQLSSWIFAQNNNFFNGNTLKQKQILTLQLHGTYIFKPGTWIAASIGSKSEGEVVLNGVEQNTPQNGIRFGAAFAYRLNSLNSIKIVYTNGITPRYGADFNTVLLGFQFLWFDKIK